MSKKKRKWFTKADYEKGLCTKDGFPLTGKQKKAPAPEPEPEIEPEVELPEEPKVEENENGDSTAT
jgi:hypothetical protein